MKVFIKQKMYIAVIVGLLFIAFAAYMVFCFARTERNNNEKGIRVECTVTKVWRVGDKDTAVDGFYINEKGERIDAQVVNAIEPQEGDIIVGYVIPGSPDRVHIPSTPPLAFLLIAVAFGFVLGGSYMIAAAVKYSVDYTILQREGIPVIGTVVETDMNESGDSTCYRAKIMYIDSSDGSEHIYKEISYAICRMVGDEVDLLYSKRKNGKYIAELDENKNKF